MKRTVILLIILLSFSFSTAYSDSITVTNFNDLNRGQCALSDCSLREAIIHSNLNPGVDSINLPAGTYVFEIAGTGESTAGTGDLDIWEDVIITGSGRDNTIIDGNQLDGVFEILPNVTVTLSDMTIKNGLRNEITGTGAGILNMGTLHLSNALITENQSPNGGGISNNGVLNLNDVVISENVAVINGGSLNTGYGGGIFNETGGVATLTDCTLINNSSQRNGGAVFNNTDTTLNVFSSSFTSNNSQAYGGAVATSGKLNVVDSTFNLNSADDGGAIANLEDASLTIVGTDFDQNLANGSDLNGGGAIFNYLAELVVSSSSFTNNISYGEGGGAINSTGKLSLSSSTLTGNQAIIHSSFDPQGHATWPGLGGILYLINGSEVDVVSCTISNNTAGTAGGGIYNDPGSSLLISFSVLDSNQVTSGGTASTWYGGAIHNGGTLTLNLSTLNNNSIQAGPSVGGAICSFSDADIDIYNSTISNNSADSGGGISHLSSGTLTITGSTVNDNTAEGLSAEAYGGGVHTGSKLIIKNSTLSGNHSAHAGGAIAANGPSADVTLTHVTMTQNTADTIASAVFNWQGHVTTESTLFNGSCNHWEMEEGTFVGDENNNSPADQGGNLESPGNTCAFSSLNSQFNYSGVLTDDLADNGGETLSCLPVFGSPLIDGGINSDVLVDQRGAPRNVDGDGNSSAISDIGAVEYNSHSSDTVLNLIAYYYLNILGRAPDQEGLNAWSAEMVRLKSIGLNVQEGFVLLAKLFFNSPEYVGFEKNETEYISDLYSTFFQRTPSVEEVDFWSTRIGDGVARNTVMNYFVFSPEFSHFMRELFGFPTGRPENMMVGDFYRGLLGRFPDNDGYLYWLDRIRTEQCNANSDAIRDLALQVVNLFMFSQEYLDRNRSASEFVEDIYDGIMRRDGDAAGINFWVNELLSESRTKEQLIEFFANSDEFQIRVSDVIMAGCSPN